MSSALTAAASGVFNARQLLRQQNEQHCINKIARALKNQKPGAAADKRLEAIIHQYTVIMDDIDEARVIVKACKMAFGDPSQWWKRMEKPYAYQYYNPTLTNISIAPLGIVAEDGSLITHVVPGGCIWIPSGYTRGGKSSAVNGVAPQLKLMPNIELLKEDILDLRPESYAEWITYWYDEPSACCKKPLFWSDKNQCLFCGRCEKQVRL